MLTYVAECAPETLFYSVFVFWLMGINYKIPPGSAYNDVFVFRCRPAIGVLDAMSIRYLPFLGSGRSLL